MSVPCMSCGGSRDDAPLYSCLHRANHNVNTVCAHCGEEILPTDYRADIITMESHRECALRSVLGGIGHLIDHAHFCHDVGPDAGLDYRTSALMVDVWVHRKGVEAAARIESS